jgi:hypothetical protein
MGCGTGYLVILQSGAGGYLGSATEADACDRASYFDGEGWLFHFEVDGYSSGRHRRSRQVVRLRLVSTLGRPHRDAIPAALAVAGMRHCVDYSIDCE